MLELVCVMILHAFRKAFLFMLPMVYLFSKMIRRSLSEIMLPVMILLTLCGATLHVLPMVYLLREGILHTLLLPMAYFLREVILHAHP